MNFRFTSAAQVGDRAALVGTLSTNYVGCRANFGQLLMSAGKSLNGVLWRRRTPNGPSSPGRFWAPMTCGLGSAWLAWIVRGSVERASAVLRVGSPS